ncbi:MAG: peptidylprolyl isomerase [Armatimonadetes bacterium]|nr:peptidylprolyl isomerase [Armatimonadota bacterium]
MTIDQSKSYTATVCLENGGEFTFELYPKEAPITVNSFVFLARERFYDGIVFHRVIADFMAQTGGSTAEGSVDVGYTFQNEPSPIRRNGPGVVSMANAGIRGGKATNSSQFFVTYARGQYSDVSYLDGYDLQGNAKDCTAERVSCHTVFGKVTDGMQVVDGIRQGDVIRAIISPSAPMAPRYLPTRNCHRCTGLERIV